MPVDDKTKKRFTNLALVGDILFEISNETADQTHFFMAKSALAEFQKDMEALELGADIERGMQNLLNYLHKKIDKRMRQSVNGEFSKD